jgi:hypothetical protein
LALSLLASLRIVAANLLDEPLRVLAPDERLDGVAEREAGREGVVNDRIDDHGVMLTPPPWEGLNSPRRVRRVRSGEGGLGDHRDDPSLVDARCGQRQ